LILSENERDCSIILGKLNGTQYAAMAVAAALIMGNHMAVTVVNTMRHLEINLLKPLIIKNVLYSLKMLNDMCDNLSSKFAFFYIFNQVFLSL
jgi:fumarate hydratase class II